MPVLRKEYVLHLSLIHILKEMKVGFGCDHTAIDLKKELMEYMTEKGYECVDYGAYDASVRVDYPDQGQKVAEAIIAGEVEKGVLICGTGIGISLGSIMFCSHHSRVRLAADCCTDTRHFVCCQIIAFGARVVGNEMAKMILDSFFNTPFEGGRCV